MEALDELHLRCIVCFEYGSTLGDLACCHSLVCQVCSNKLRQCPVCKVALVWSVNVPVTRLCQGMALKDMSFATSARLGSKLYGGAIFRLELFEKLPNDTGTLLQLSLELHDHGRLHGEMLAKFVIDHAEEQNRAKLRKAFILGRVQLDFLPALRRLLLERSVALEPSKPVHKLLTDVWRCTFPAAGAKPIASAPRAYPLSPSVTAFRVPRTKGIGRFVSSDALPPGLLPTVKPGFYAGLDFGEAELEMPDGSSLRCSTKTMLTLLWLPGRTEEIRRRCCQFAVDFKALGEHAVRVDGVWMLK
jgi:hypothetical protein